MEEVRKQFIIHGYLSCIVGFTKKHALTPVVGLWLGYYFKIVSQLHLDVGLLGCKTSFGCNRVFVHGSMTAYDPCWVAFLESQRKEKWCLRGVIGLRYSTCYGLVWMIIYEAWKFLFWTIIAASWWLFSVCSTLLFIVHSFVCVCMFCIADPLHAHFFMTDI